MPIMNTVIASGGVIPTGTKSITANGIHDVAGYANADVNVPTTAPAHYVEKSVDANGVLVNRGNTVINLNGVTGIGVNALAYAYTGNVNITGAVDFSSVTTISSNGMQYCFKDCYVTSVDLSSLTTVGNNGMSSCFQYGEQITSVDLSSLTTVDGSGMQSCFRSCTRITSIDLSSLTTVRGSGLGYCFQGCTSLTRIDLPSLTTIASNGLEYCFNGCTGITSIDLSSLTTVDSRGLQYCFQGCTSLTALSFYALDTNSFGTSKNQFNNMLSGVTGCTVHFPMAIQSTIGSWTSVTNGFSGTNTTVLFDIVTTITGADTNSYTRKQKDSTPTATAWEYNSTVYYTSGTAEPVVGDTIYSDDACTTAVTTISSIA